MPPVAIMSLLMQPGQYMCKKMHCGVDPLFRTCTVIPISLPPTGLIVVTMRPSPQ